MTAEAESIDFRPVGAAPRDHTFSGPPQVVSALDATSKDACTFLHPATRYVLPEHFASPTLVTEAGSSARRPSSGHLTATETGRRSSNR
jgi:hypothetical protein